MSCLQTITPASTPPLSLSEALSSCETPLPSLDRFLEDGIKRCERFRAQFPNIHSKEPNPSIWQAFSKTISFLAHAFTSPLDPLPKDSPTLQESLEEGQRDLRNVQHALQQRDDPSVREEQFFLDFCQPTIFQGEEAIKQWTRQVKRLVKTKNAALSPSIEMGPIFRPLNRQIVLEPPNSAAKKAIYQRSSYKKIADFTGWIPSPAHLQPLYNFSSSLETEYKNENYDGILQTTKALFHHFNFYSLPPDFFQNLSSTQADRLLSSLTAVGNFYFKSYFDAQVSHLPDAESALLMMEIMTMANQLLTRLPEEYRLGEFQLPMREISPYLFNRNPFFRLAQPELDERLGALKMQYPKESKATLFQTNMAPITKQLFGLFIGNYRASPGFSIVSVKTPIKSLTRDFPPVQETALFDYLKQFLPDYEKKYPNNDKTHATKIKEMLTEEASDILPQAFYDARQITFLTEYFFRGAFVKPSHFKKTENSYNLRFHAVSDRSLSLKAEVQAWMAKKFLRSGYDIWWIYPQVEGIDASVFEEHPLLADGHTKAHQFTHLQRPLTDPFLQSLFQPYLEPATASSSNWIDRFNALILSTFEGGFNPFFHHYHPGITEAGRPDLNIVMGKQHDRDSQILASLRGEPLVQIANTLSFFQRRPDLLKNPDMQTYFNNLMFDPSLLSEELKLAKRGPILENQLATFAADHYNLNYRLNDFETANYFLSFAARIRQYCLFARKRYPQIYNKTKMPELFLQFDSLLQHAMETFPEKYKGALHGLAAESWLTKDPPKTKEEVQEFLQHIHLYHLFPPSGKIVDPWLNANLRSLLAKFALPAPIAKPGSMPADGLNSRAYLSLYGAQEFKAESIDTNTFQFIDRENHTNRLIRISAKEFAIQRRLGDSWYQYIPPHLLIPASKEPSWIETLLHIPSQNAPLPIIPSKQLIDGYTHWYSPEEILIFDRKNTLQYKALMSGSQILKGSEKTIQKIIQVDALGQETSEFVDPEQEASRFSWIAPFEDLKHVLIWKDPKTSRLERIEFPRIGKEGLSFVHKNGRLESENFPGFFLQSTQSSPLHLRDDKGNEQLLFSGNPLAQRIPLYVFQKPKDAAAFSSKEREANLYLSMVHGKNKKDVDAIRLLREQGEKNAPFAPEEISILHQIMDLDSANAALKALSWSLLKKQSHVNPGKEHLIAEYFLAVQKEGAVRLSTEEERFLLQEDIRNGADSPPSIAPIMARVTALQLQPILEDPFAFLNATSEKLQTIPCKHAFEKKREEKVEAEAFQFYLKDVEHFLKNREEIQFHLKDLPSFQKKRGELEQIALYMRKSLPLIEQSLSPLKDLLQMFLHNDFHALKDWPKQAIDKLAKRIDLFLDLSIQNAQRERIIQSMRNVEKDPHNHLALQEFVKEATLKREYDDSKHRFLKVFEYHNGFYFREAQIQKMGLLGTLDQDPVAKSLIFEMGVGAGKSTALLPTYAYACADGKRLCMAVMTEELMKNQIARLEEILGESYSQRVKLFQFDPKQPLTSKRLAQMLHMLEEAIEKKEYLITTDKSLKAFSIQFVKTLEQALATKQKEPMDKSEAMRKILQLFLHKTHALFDEADRIFDTRLEYNAPQGEPISLKESYFDLILKTFSFLPNQSITPQLYQKKIAPTLVKQWLHFLSSKDAAEPLSNLRAFYQKSDRAGKRLIEMYLLNQDANGKALQWIQNAPDDIKDLLALNQYILHSILPLTLQKNYKEHFGFHSSEEVIAKPFRSSDHPSFGSQFSEPFEASCYTVLAHLQEKGIAKPILENLVQDLRRKAMQEMQEKAEEMKKLPANATYQTKAHLDFETYFGKEANLPLFDTKLVDKLVQLTHTNPKVKFALLRNYVLPQIKIHPNNVKATSQTVGALFQNAFGFTGTLWNANTFHDRFLDAIQLDQGARGKIIYLALTQAKDKVQIVSQNEIFQTQPQVFIDAGGTLRDKDLKEVAHQWLQKSPPSIQGVVYFDANGKEMIWERGQLTPRPLSKSSCPLHKRRTIYDQKSTTGTDLQQPIDAVAVVTVSKKMILRDFLQAVGRMRQLGSGQKIEIAILEEDAAVMRESLKVSPDTPLNIEEVIQFLIINEAERQIDDTQVATTHKLTATIQDWFLNKILNAKTMEEVARIAPAQFVKNLFFQSVSISPFKDYGEASQWIDAKRAYRMQKDLLLKRLNIRSLFPKEFSSLQKKLDAVIRDAKLPTKVQRSMQTMGREEEVQQEIAQEQQMQQEQSIQQEEMQHTLDPNFTPWRHALWQQLLHKPYSLLTSTFYKPEPAREGAHFLKANDLIQNANAKIFSDRLLLSQNFQLFQKTYQGTPVQPFGQFQKPIQNIAIVQNKKLFSNKYALVVLEPYDAASFKHALLTMDEPQGPNAPLPIFSSADPDLTLEKRDQDRIVEQPTDFFSALFDWKCIKQHQSGHCDDKPPPIIRSIDPDSRIWIGDLQLHTMYESENSIPQKDLQGKEVGMLLTQAKYFNGEVQYSEKEKGYLRAWFQSQKNPIEEVERFFTTTILGHKETMKRDYPDSDLSKVFQTLRKK